MARLDLGGLRDLWYRIDDIFARITEAAGSLALSGTSLVLRSVSGGTLSNVDLNGTFATDSEAAHSLSWNSPNLTLNNVNGGSLGSVNLNSGLATDAQAGHSLGISSRTITLYSVDGGSLGSVTVPETSTDGLMHASTANDRFGHSLYYNSSTKQLSLISYDGTALSTVTIS